MNSAATQLRRIALRAAGKQHDLVVPRGDALAHVLATAGVHLGPHDQVLGPDGTVIDPATTAAVLREGGLYSVTHSAHVADRARSRADQAGSVRTLPWVLVACALAAALVAVAAGDAASRWVAAGVIALAAVLTTLAWAQQAAKNNNFLTLATPLALGVLAGVLSVPAGVDDAASFAIAMGAAGAATLAALLAVATKHSRIRAGASAVVVIAMLVAALALASPSLRWSPAQLAVVLAAASVLALRALPSLLVNVDEGYFIDYGKFMVLRWTVRGRVPEYIPLVEADRVRQLVSNAEARLRVSTLLLSLLVAIGLPAAAILLAGGDLLVQISAIAFLVLAPLGMVLTSRRTVSSELRNPPRIAVLVGLLLCAVGIGSGLIGLTASVAAGALLFAACVAAVLSVSAARGSRSLGWSRTADIVDSMAVALVLPAGFLAAGTFDLLRGALAG